MPPGPDSGGLELHIRVLHHWRGGDLRRATDVQPFHRVRTVIPAGRQQEKGREQSTAHGHSVARIRAKKKPHSRGAFFIRR